jgi:hypothetical protein
MISVFENNDLEKKPSKLSHACGTMRTALSNNTEEEAQITFYKPAAIPALTYSS